MERWENRLTLPGLSISKRYLEGKLEILADFDFICNGTNLQYCAIFYPIRLSAQQCQKGLVIGEKRTKRRIRNNDTMKNRNKQLMFISDVEVMNGSKHIEPSFIWLKRANYINDIWGGTVYVSSFDGTLKVIPFQTKRKINVFSGLPVKPNQITGEKIQGSSKIMNCISNNQWEVDRDLFSHLDGPRTLSTIRAFLDNNSVRITVQEGSNFRIKLRDVALGPINL